MHLVRYLSCKQVSADETPDTTHVQVLSCAYYSHTYYTKYSITPTPTHSGLFITTDPQLWTPHTATVLHYKREQTRPWSQTELMTIASLGTLEMTSSLIRRGSVWMVKTSGLVYFGWSSYRPTLTAGFSPTLSLSTSLATLTTSAVKKNWFSSPILPLVLLLLELCLHVNLSITINSLVGWKGFQSRICMCLCAHMCMCVCAPNFK